MYVRPVEFHLSGSASMSDAELADLRDLLVEVVTRFPGVELHGYSASGWLYDGTADEGEPPTAGRVEARINQLLETIATMERKVSTYDVLRERVAPEIKRFRALTDLEFVLEDTGGGCFWLRAASQESDRQYILTEFPEVLGASSDPYSPDWNGWLLSVVSGDDFSEGLTDAGVTFPERTMIGEPVDNTLAELFPDEFDAAEPSKGLRFRQVVTLLNRLERL
jgi:hypothetical protein